MNKRFLLVVGLVVGCFIFLSVGMTFADNFGQQSASTNGWMQVFTETFTNTLSMWTFTETTSTGYQWGVVPYSRTVGGSTLVNDFGLWAPGGGTLGENLTWYTTDTYTNNMTTLAVAGPISLTGNVSQARLFFDVFNNIDQSDTFSVALSIDGVTYLDAAQVNAVPGSWQSFEWTTDAVQNADEVWIILSFESDDAYVHMGPLVDNIGLEIQTVNKVFIPFMQLDPTPTATPTPTPTPIPDYVDHFDDPLSGWFVGEAWRENRRYLDGVWKFVWEVVNYIQYLDGHYQMYIPLTCHGNDESNPDTWFVRTVEYAPMPVEMSPLPQNYCVEVSAYIAGDYDPQYLLGHWGIVFGGNADKTQVYTFQVNSQGRFHLLEYDNYVYPGRRVDSNFPGENIEIKLYDVGDEFRWGNPRVPMNSSHYHNTLKAAVKGDRIYPYINGQCVKDEYNNCISASIPGMPRDRIGLIGASWEPTPVDVRFEYFWYDPFCPEVQ
jgi:hypothetical protein